ncbi:MAG: hypothetical protein Fur0046_17610 [Cyanobacteria bacterium J069]|nr:MAG: hypothetical protein D6742_01015 [Cyanobacteria bacterium J069]
MTFGFSYLSPSGIKERFDIDQQTLEAIVPNLEEGVHYIRTPGGHLRVCVEMFADWLVNQDSSEAHTRAIEYFRNSLPSTPQSKGRKKSGGGGV